MKKGSDQAPDPDDVRRRAEQQLAARRSREGGDPSPSLAEAAALVHELQVHQIELEMQNEELLRSRAEAEAARERYADLYDFAPVGYFTVTGDSTIRQLNLTGARLLGLERSRLVDRRLGGLLAEADRPALEAALRKAALDQTRESCEVALAAAPGGPGHPRTLQMTVSAPRGEPAELRVVAVDVTERRRSEEQLRTSQKLDAIGRLAGGVAHDFNNVLTVILNHAEVALGAVAPDAPLHGSLVAIQEAAQRAAALTRQLLAFNRRQAVRPQVVDLNVLVRGFADMLHRVLGEDIDLVLSLDPNVAPVEVDPTQIDQVIMNLAVNARDAMPRGGSLTLSTAGVALDPAHRPRGGAASAFVRLTVTDTGAGMDPGTMAHLFEPFFTTKERGSGTGLGLSTVFGIVKQSGGHVTVSSEPGKGTSFEINLPRSTALPAPPPRRADERTSSERGTETILVLEDEDALLRICTLVLAAAGYTVLGAASGAEALRACEEHEGTIHLALSDIIMPGMSGVGFARRLRALRPETKVLYMSGYTDDALASHGVAERDVPLLGKPFTGEQLRQKVREVLDAPVSTRATPAR